MQQWINSCPPSAALWWCKAVVDAHLLGLQLRRLPVLLDLLLLVDGDVWVPLSVSLPLQSRLLPPAHFVVGPPRLVQLRTNQRAEHTVLALVQTEAELLESVSSQAQILRCLEVTGSQLTFLSFFAQGFCARTKPVSTSCDSLKPPNIFLWKESFCQVRTRSPSSDTSERQMAACSEDRRSADDRKHCQAFSSEPYRGPEEEEGEELGGVWHDHTPNYFNAKMATPPSSFNRSLLFV